jgi:hypothetical protein
MSAVATRAVDIESEGVEMSDNKEERRPRLPAVLQMLAGVPKELWSIFLPQSPSDLPTLELNIIRFRVREEERRQVMAIQKLSNLPLRPNHTLRATQARARLQGIMKERMLNRYNKRRSAE